MRPVLYAYRYSAYSWMVRLVLAEKGVSFDYVEVNPFTEGRGPDHAARQPFGRVPVLDHDGFVLYETVAINHYLDETFAAPALQPAGVAERARMRQVMSVVDSYAYWPLVRQVFSHGFFRPVFGLPTDPAVYAEGLAAAPGVLAALDRLVAPDGYVAGPDLSLADVHLGPVIAYFTMVPEGAAMLERHPALSRWWALMGRRPSLAATRPAYPGGPGATLG